LGLRRIAGNKASGVAEWSPLLLWGWREVLRVSAPVQESP
jgi:hypothetical protein